MANRKSIAFAVLASLSLHAALLLHWAFDSHGRRTSSKASGPVFMQAYLLPPERKAARPVTEEAPAAAQRAPVPPVVSGPLPDVVPVVPVAKKSMPAPKRAAPSGAPALAIDPRVQPSPARAGSAEQRVAVPESVRESAPSMTLPSKESTPASVATDSPALAPNVESSVYHSHALLDPPPRVLIAVEPVYPRAATARDGRVVLRLRISASGRVEEALVLESSPAGLFDASAVVAFRLTLFSPGYLLGRAVPSEMTVEVDYSANGVPAQISGSSGTAGPVSR